MSGVESARIILDSIPDVEPNHGLPADLVWSVATKLRDLYGKEDDPLAWCNDAHVILNVVAPALRSQVEGMREAADKMKHRCYTLSIPPYEMEAYQAHGFSDGWSSAIRVYRRAIAALPLPTDPDHQAQASMK